MHDAVERLAHDPAVDRGHDVVALGRRNEFRRRDQRARLVAQPQHQLEVLARRAAFAPIGTIGW